MKQQTSKAPTRHNYVILGQFLKLIPRNIIEQTAREFGLDKQVRTYSVYSHLAGMLFAQIAHVLSLNDLCDHFRLKEKAIAAFGVTPPSRNNLSHANATRSAEFMNALFWRVLAHLFAINQSFQKNHLGKNKLLHRFKVKVHAIDSSVLELVANCMDWAKHRRRKAAAKLHMNLDQKNFLPSFVIVDVAREHDASRARELCANLSAGEIVVCDRGYIDFDHLFDLDQREVQWVTRAKSNMQYEVVKELSPKGNTKIIRDEVIRLTGKKSGDKKFANWEMRRVEAWVKVNEVEQVMVFLTNNMQWAASSVCNLYRSRWDIEVFFKQIKQTLKLSGFLGYSANAIRWQVWSALLVYVLLRYLGHLSDWSHSFSRLFTAFRSAMWERMDLLYLLERYGTAGGSYRLLGALHQAWLKGFEP